MDGTYLAIYLNDHLAGSTAVLSLVKRAAREHRGTELGSFFTGLAAEIEEDRGELKRVMAAMGAAEQRAKQAVAWTAEKAARLKLNGHVVSRSPLTPFIETEAVEVGVYGKLLLWRVLRSRHGDEGPGGVRLDALVDRAESQLARLERHRLAAAAAFERDGRGARV